MYGFGSPRVGNIPFAEKFDDMVFNAWRISNMNDIVTKCAPSKIFNRSRSAGGRCCRSSRRCRSLIPPLELSKT